MNTAAYLLDQQDDSQRAVITSQGVFTYGDLKAAVAAMQSHFISMGAQPKDRIGIWAPNSMFWIAAYLASLSIGAIAVPFATTLTGSDFEINQEAAGCSILCVDDRLYRKHAPAISSQVKIVKSGDPAAQPSAGAQPWFYDQAIDHQDAVYLFTSGTTAYPRIVRITHANLQANTESIIHSLSLTASERIMVILPFYYCFGTSLLHTHLRMGASLVLTGSMVFPETILDQIEQQECTGIAGVPTHYQTFLRNTSFKKRELPSLKKIQQAGGKLSNVLIEELVDSRPNSQVFIMYGQTEATARLSCLEPALVRAKLGSIGRGIPGVELRVLDDNGQPVQPGQVGEIVARGANVSPGYLNEPAANAEKFTDGALHTGDMASVDADGFIYIVDRKSDFIKSYGNRVSSQQVEAIALALPDVVSAAAVGAPDPLRGEAIVLFVTLKAGATLQTDDILLHFKTNAAPHVVPREVRVLASMPVNAHSKIVKSELKKLLPAG